MIGAGVGQVFLSKKIKKRGDYLITVTMPGKQPVISIADKVIYNDVFDKEGILKIIRNEGIDGVISDQNDTMMPTVSYIAEKMNLPGVKVSQIDAYCNKNRFRDNCDILDIPVPKHTKITDIEFPDDFKSVPFPWIVKPADSQSSVGVEKVCNKEQYISAIGNALDYSKSKSAIVEEFFEGQELVAEGFIYKGKYYNLGFADRKYFKLDKLFIPSQTIFPSMVDTQILESIIKCEERMTDYIKPDFAIVHSEYLYNPNTKEFRVVESALRGGGVYISSHLIPLYSGIDIYDVLLDCMSGKPVDVLSVITSQNRKASGYICFYLPEGVINRIDGLEKVKGMDCVKMVCLDDINIGIKTPALTHKGQRLGPIIVTGKNRDEIDDNILSIQRILDISVIGDDGIEHGIIWE